MFQWFTLAMDKSYGLPVLREESPIRDVYQLVLRDRFNWTGNGIYASLGARD